MTIEYKTIIKKITSEVKEDVTIYTIPRNETAKDKPTCLRTNKKVLTEIADLLNSAFWFDETA